MKFIKDALVFLSKDTAPIRGSISYQESLNANTTLTINSDSKTVKIASNQIELAIFKYNDHAFGFIFKTMFTTIKASLLFGTKKQLALQEASYMDV